MKRMSVDARPYRVKRAVYQRSKVTEDSDPRDRALIEYLEWRERHKIHVSGDIYRLPGTKGYQSETWDITWWTVEVWDTELSATLLFAEQNPDADIVKFTFTYFKKERLRTRSND
jgi:hypothetical protein